LKKGDYAEAKIINWFVTGIRNEAIRLSKKNEKIKDQEALVLNKPMEQDENKVELIDILAGVDNVERAVGQSAFLNEALSILTEKQRKIIVATVLESQKEKVVARNLGMTQPAVSQMKARALKKLKEYLALAKGRKFKNLSAFIYTPY